jgi:Bifunctional DNA primase/polymerase, N-terminal
MKPEAPREGGTGSGIEQGARAISQANTPAATLTPALLRLAARPPAMLLDLPRTRDLDTARHLVEAGVPVFVAPPGWPEKSSAAVKGWQTTTPDPAQVDRWQPGWALCAVGGHAVDFIDVDPRNGGQESVAEIARSGHWPASFGRQRTPSGGWHYLISPLGQRKGTLADGIDTRAEHRTAAAVCSCSSRRRCAPARSTGSRPRTSGRTSPTWPHWPRSTATPIPSWSSWSGPRKLRPLRRSTRSTRTPDRSRLAGDTRPWSTTPAT